MTQQLAALAVLVMLASHLTPAADQPGPRPETTAKPLSKETRQELSGLLRTVGPRAKAGFPRVAMTIEQARRYADVGPKSTWQAEFAGWFIFGVPDLRDGPDPWSGIVFVQKGTNLVGYYRETW